MSLLDEFDKKVDQASSKLENLLENVAQMKSVNDLLIDEGQRQSETNNNLRDVCKSLTEASVLLKQSLIELSNSTKVITETDPARLIQKIDSHQTLNSEKLEKLEKQLSQSDIKLEQINILSSQVDKLREDISEVVNQAEINIKTEEKRIFTLLIINVFISLGLVGLFFSDI